MILRPELDSDPPIGSDRESGRDTYPIVELCQNILPLLVSEAFHVGPVQRPFV